MLCVAGSKRMLFGASYRHQFLPSTLMNEGRIFQEINLEK